jgi:hypothetical protein
MKFGRRASEQPPLQQCHRESHFTTVLLICGRQLDSEYLSLLVRTPPRGDHRGKVLADSLGSESIETSAYCGTTYTLGRCDTIQKRWETRCGTVIPMRSFRTRISPGVLNDMYVMVLDMRIIQRSLITHIARGLSGARPLLQPLLSTSVGNLPRRAMSMPWVA